VKSRGTRIISNHDIFIYRLTSKFTRLSPHPYHQIIYPHQKREELRKLQCMISIINLSRATVNINHLKSITIIKLFHLKISNARMENSYIYKLSSIAHSDVYAFAQLLLDGLINIKDDAAAAYSSQEKFVHDASAPHIFESPSPSRDTR